MKTLDFEREQTVWLCAAPASDTDDLPGGAGIQGSGPPQGADEALERIFKHHIGVHQGRRLDAAAQDTGWDVGRSGDVLAAFRSMDDAVLCAVAIQRDLARMGIANGLSGPGGPAACRIGIKRGHFEGTDPLLRQADRRVLATLCDTAQPGGICFSATSDSKITRNIPPAVVLDDTPPAPNRLALGLQSALILGYFLFWCGLIIWRNWYVAVHKVAPCWPSFLCN